MNFSKIKENNSYIIIYASVMVIIVAFLLAFVASALKPIQDANVLRDTKNQILMSLNIVGLKGVAVDQKYEEVVTDTIAVADKVVYQASVDGAIKYVFPVKGRGLWGGLWGYISLDEDKQNVFGTYFSHESETAGLGSRIAEREFQERFNGRPLFADDPSTIALTVTKDGAAKTETEVNGITGATLTSVGVAAMVTDGLQAYIEFINNANEQVACPKAKPCKQECSECPKGKCAQNCADCPNGESCEKEACKENCADCPKEKCLQDSITCPKKEACLKADTCSKKANCPKVNVQN